MKTPISYRSRKEQIEKDILPRLITGLALCGSPIDRHGKQAIANAFKSVAMIGAAAERQHCLKIVRKYPTSSDCFMAEIDRGITEQSVFAVLGYPESNKQLAAPAVRRGRGK